MPLLEVDKLTMKFGGLTAVNQVDLVVEPGKICSVIGPNGAGKTTVFNAITGIYEPTSGEVRFAGRRLERPFTSWVALFCLLVGVATGVFGALFMGNIDKLWRAGIRRNLYDDQRPFRYANVIDESLRYWRGGLATERQNDGTYVVVSANASQQFATAPSREEADAKRAALEEIIAGAQPQIEEASNQFELRSADGELVLATFGTADMAQTRVDRLRTIPEERRQFRLWSAAGLLVGFVLGAAGSFAVWRRSRRTPDVISLGHLARTFQNIRLFQNMTVLENVLVGMDRKFSRNYFNLLFRLPAARTEEIKLRAEALTLLDFVGLGAKQNMLAKNLAYGEQRRLEIARALGTEPHLLLLDEPAAGMNPAESDDLMKLVHAIRARGITVVLIEHHMKLVMNISDHISVLDHGEKIAEGAPAEVKANPKVIEAYLGKEEVS